MTFPSRELIRQQLRQLAEQDQKLLGYLKNLNEAFYKNMDLLTTVMLSVSRQLVKARTKTMASEDREVLETFIKEQEKWLQEEDTRNLAAKLASSSTEKTPITEIPLSEPVTL